MGASARGGEGERRVLAAAGEGGVPSSITSVSWNSTAVAVLGGAAGERRAAELEVAGGEYCSFRV